MPKVSVIVPIYNVEKYIERCAISLFEQTLDDIEYIFVNDCTPDNSIYILESVIQKYPKRIDQIKIIQMDKNSGQALARNTGFANATGDFVIHCDSDDWIEANMYKELYTKAINSKADIVVCDFFHETNYGAEIEHYESIYNPFECLEYSKRPVWWTLWNRLVRRDLIDNSGISFVPEINYFEDMCYMMRLYYYATKIEYIDIPLYHYNRTNEASTLITYNFCKKIEQKQKCYDYLDKWFTEKEINLKIITKKKIELKNAFLTNPNYDLSKWRHTYPEIVSVVISDKSLKWSYRRCYELAAKGFFVPLKIYMWLSNTKK